MKLLDVTKNGNVYIIAEVGVNHNGCIDQCCKLIDMAKKSGVDAVKLQTIDADENYVKQSESYEIFSKLSLSQEDTAIAFDYAKSLGLDVFTTVGDTKTLAWIEELEPDAYKISSGLSTNFPLIEDIIALQRPVILSTGLSDLEEVDEVVQQVFTRENRNFYLLHCVSLYPTPSNQLNLSRIRYFKECYDFPIGYSDHALGIDAVLYAVAAGAVIIEKHITLDSNQTGADHSISLGPNELTLMVRKIRDIEIMLGRPDALLNLKLQLHKEKYQRCLVASKEIAIGDALSLSNVAIKRSVPGKVGLAPKYFREVIGKKLSSTILKDEPITEEILK